MMTYQHAKKKCVQMLEQAEIENAVAESGFLMEFALDVNRTFYLLHQMDEMPKEQYDAYMSVTEKRCTHIPLQYITGEQEFMGLLFRVNENVLIPRQDTEILVEKCLDTLKGMSSKKILDLCTGSGCIAVSLKYYVSEADVTASDISEGALQVAIGNAKENGADVTFLHSDLFNAVTEKYDMIVSNPPYIPSDVVWTLMPEVRDHEPMGALDGSDDGLFFYRRIVEQSADYLNQGGFLLFEIGHDQGAAVSGMMREHGFDDIEVIADLAGLDRVVKGRKY